MLEVYPLFDVLKLALRGSGDCALVDWTFLGASIAEWSLLWFVAILVMQLLVVLPLARKLVRC